MYLANEVMFPQLNINRLQEATKTSTMWLCAKLRVSFSLPDGCFQTIHGCHFFTELLSYLIFGALTVDTESNLFSIRLWDYTGL